MRLKELRIKYEFTQLQIAELIGVSLYKYRKYEKTGGKTMSLRAAECLAYLYGVTFEYLMGESYIEHVLSILG